MVTALILFALFCIFIDYSFRVIVDREDEQMKKNWHQWEKHHIQ